MRTSKRGRERLIVGAGGTVLIVSLFVPWASVGDGDRSGWEFSTMAVFLLIVGLVAIGAAITGGRFGLLRPDMSLNGASDLLAVVATILIAWLILFDFPRAAGREIGVFLALISAMAIAGGAGDYATLRGAPLFPPTGGDEQNAD